MLMLDALSVQIRENHLGQHQHHHCSHANSQPSSTMYVCLTIYHLPRHGHYPSLMETRILHNLWLVQTRTFSNTNSYVGGSMMVDGWNAIHDDTITNTI
jgi:hypothetical protein